MPRERFRVLSVDMDIGGRLRRLRIERGLSTQALAFDVGLSAQQLYKYETGQNSVTASGAMTLALALGVEMEELLPSLDEVAETGCPGVVVADKKKLRRTAALSRSLDLVPIDKHEMFIATIRQMAQGFARRDSERPLMNGQSAQL